ncbi:MAG TPA: 5'-nucleotidase C-terminal domain-containing protein [Gemmatimonadaceae bacterium]|nr:5'-nucleotidase C-terminal domain-containing protein [Gemmatimonadaceae bacterium]
MKHIRIFLCGTAALAALSCSAGSSPGAAPVPSDAREIIVLSTTDVHGRIRAWDYYTDSVEPRGLSRAATIVDSIRAANRGRVILIDAGDLLQGNPFTFVAARVSRDSANPVIAAMNAMSYDAAAVGNHEYNYGVNYLERAVAQARFPFLSANTYRPDGSHAFKPWTIVERSGVKVGIIGATTPGVMLWDEQNVRGRLTLSDIVPAVRSAVNEVRAAGADVIVVDVHSGLNERSSYDTVTTHVASENVAERIAKEIPGIDLVVFGHSHKEVAQMRIGSTLLMQPKNWATSVGVAHLHVARDGNRWRVAESRGEVVQTANHAEQSSVVAAADLNHRRTIEFAHTAIGSTPVAWKPDSARLMDTPIVDFILETERRATGADLASTPMYSLSAGLDAGPITVAELSRLYPYENTLKAVRISGKQLRDYLEYSSRYFTGIDSSVTPVRFVIDQSIPGYNYDIIGGANYTIDLRKPVGSRITTLLVKGKPVAETDSFTLALNNYRQSGGGGYSMLAGAPVVYDKQQDLRQLLIDEVTARKTIKPEDYFTQNWGFVYPVSGTRRVQSEFPTGSMPPQLTPPLPKGTPRLRIIATNDFHGALEPRADANKVVRGGAAYVAAVINAAKNECAPSCEILLVDGGDMFQGTPASNLAFGRPVVDYYNRMGYAVSVVGNHEFDWGLDTLRARMRQAHYAILGANIRYADGRDVPWIRDDTIITRGKTKIGIIGFATVTTPTQTRASNVAGLRFDEPAPIVSERAKALRARGADVVIAVGHSGAFCNATGMDACNGEIIDFAHALTEKVDAIVSAHTHSLVDYAVNGIPIVQARSSGRAVAVIDIPLANGKPAGIPHEEVRDVIDSAIKPVASIDSLVRRATAKVESFVNRRIAEIATTLDREGNQYPLGNLIADAQRWAGKGDIAIMNNGGIRANLNAGTATYGSLFEIQPFGNTLYRIRMNGAQLRDYLARIVNADSPRFHISGATIRFNPQLPKDKRLTSLELTGGKTLNDSATYDLIVNDFMATGGDGMGPPAGVHATPLNIVDLDALVNYLKSLPSPVTAPAEPRIVVAQ